MHNRNHKHDIQLWFDFASTYSYLALFAVKPLGAQVRLRPFLLGPVFSDQGWNDSPFNIYPAKGRYMWRDMERLCERAQLPLVRPSVFPRSGLLAARIALAGADDTWVPDFCRQVFSANFAEDRDIADPSVLQAILTSLNLDAPAVLARAQQPDIKQTLRSQTARAVELGIFGAPTFEVDGELFWGGDRLEQAVAWANAK
jgi:2-hydroxychromene-2-carboxylate isomerase